MAPAIPIIAGISGLLSAGAGVAGMVKADRERKSAKKEAAAERSKLQKSEAKKREEQFARMNARGASERGSILAPSNGNAGDTAIGRKRLLGE